MCGTQRTVTGLFYFDKTLWMKAVEKRTLNIYPAPMKASKEKSST